MIPKICAALHTQVPNDDESFAPAERERSSYGFGPRSWLITPMKPSGVLKVHKAVRPPPRRRGSDDRRTGPLLR